MTPTGPYRPPTPAERAKAVAALEALLAGQPPDLAGLPLHLVHGLDAAGRPFTLLTDTPPTTFDLAPPPHPHTDTRDYPTPPNITASPAPLSPPDIATSPNHPNSPSPPNQPGPPTHPTSLSHPNPPSVPTSLNHPSPTHNDNPSRHSHSPSHPNAPTHLNPPGHPIPGWGALALRATTTLLIEVPHPGSDRLTARLGLDLFHAIPTAALLIAGAHRKAADNAADVAHRPDSLFHALAQTLATTEIQLHGFAATTAPDTDAVLSPGAGSPTTLHHALAKALAQQGFRLNHHEHLAGRTNAQGIAAAARGTPFLHLELAPPLRLHHRHTLVETIANAWHQQGQ